MSLRVSGKNLDIGDALRGHVEGRVAEALSKYFDGGFSGHVTIEREGAGFRADCSLHLDSGVDLQSNATAPDAYASFDQAAERLEKRLRRYKRRLKDYHLGHSAAATATSYVLSPPADEGDADAVEENEHQEFGASYSPAVIAERAIRLSQMPVSAAVMELDLSGAPVVLFRNAGTGRINVVYRRSDGNIGWIEPPASEDAS